MASQDVQTFNLFEFLDNLDIWDRFDVMYDPGDQPGREVYKFTGSVREKNEDQMMINYTFQKEYYFGHCVWHSVCYGVMIIESKTKTVLRYSLKDKYDDFFTPTPSAIFGTFNDAEQQECLAWNWRVSEEGPSDENDSAEWEDEGLPWTETPLIKGSE